jgi:hypothetical protein
MDKKDFIVKETQSFRLRVKHWKCLSPGNLNSVEIINECLDKDGEVEFSSTYNFFMTNDEIITLANKLMESLE